VTEPALVAALALVAEVLFMVLARATAPTALAAPAPRVIADTQASPLLRARCRVEGEAGEPFKEFRLWAGGYGRLACSWFMPPRSFMLLSAGSAQALNHL
jgi:hypothetical protein